MPLTGMPIIQLAATLKVIELFKCEHFYAKKSAHVKILLSKSYI